jgi:DegV family protein with EDD domain
MNIGIITDSTCDLSQGVLEQHNIEYAPLSIHFGETVYLDRLELGSEEFFSRLEGSEVLPTTSQPSIGLFVEKYKEMARKYDAIISIHISEKLSGTVKSARMAAAQFDDLNIEVIDSRSTSLGLGFLVLLAAQLINSGFNLEEIVEKIRKARDNVKIFFSLDDLSFLQRGGRIGKAQAFLGSILNLCPLLILSGDKGEIMPLEKIRGKNKVNKRLLEIITEELRGEVDAWLGILHGTNLANFENFKGMLRDKLADMNLKYRLETGWISSVLGSHTGPSAHGLVIFKGEFLTL